MRRIALTVAYDGTDWCGSQRQSNGPTIQGELERVLEALFKAATPVTLAGRTDAGVHARGQVAAFETENRSLPVERFGLAMNAQRRRTDGCAVVGRVIAGRGCCCGTQSFAG